MLTMATPGIETLAGDLFAVWFQVISTKNAISNKIYC